MGYLKECVTWNNDLIVLICATLEEYKWHHCGQLKGSELEVSFTKNLVSRKTRKTTYILFNCILSPNFHFRGLIREVTGEGNEKPTMPRCRLWNSIPKSSIEKFLYFLINGVDFKISMELLSKFIPPCIRGLLQCCDDWWVIVSIFLRSVGISPSVSTYTSIFLLETTNIRDSLIFQRDRAISFFFFFLHFLGI